MQDVRMFTYRDLLRSCIHFIVVILIPSLSYSQSPCMWEHYSEIDCAYDFEVGFKCEGHSIYFDHYHKFGGGVLCVGGVPIPGSTLMPGCGCWDNPGGTYGEAGCAWCGDYDSLLCISSISDTLNIPFKYLQVTLVNFVPPITIRVYDYTQVDKFFDEYLYLPNTVVCCDPTTDPNMCQTCACGVAEINWRNQKTYLHRARGIYYPDCPDPNP
ncbi:MAG: hypothetical protein J5I91_05140 [Bacteroidetes bacterium]|nr:hypothetical protein [Bacteroidota bacterium]